MMKVLEVLSVEVVMLLWRMRELGGRNGDAPAVVDVGAVACHVLTVAAMVCLYARMGKWREYLNTHGHTLPLTHARARAPDRYD